MKYAKDNKIRTYLFYCIMFFIVIICIELLSQVTFFIIFGKRYSAKNLRSYVVHKYEINDRRANFVNREVIHPYIGYVFDFGDEKKNFTSQGFLTDISPVVKREPGKVNIVVLGGSVLGKDIQGRTPSDQPGLPGIQATPTTDGSFLFPRLGGPIRSGD